MTAVIKAERIKKMCFAIMGAAPDSLAALDAESMVNKIEKGLSLINAAKALKNPPREDLLEQAELALRKYIDPA